MSLQVLVLTTDTPHHAYFVAQLASRFSVSVILEEKAAAADNDPLRASLEDQSRSYETNRWFNNRVPSVRDFAPSRSFTSLRAEAALQALSEVESDVAISFGTSILRRPLLQQLPSLRFNLHGGDPERYRGLDSHLWSLYHGDMDGLRTALHVLDEGVDAGALVAVSPIDVRDVAALEQLRYENTLVATDLTLRSLAKIEQSGSLPGRPQNDASRYYSTLPGALLHRCSRMLHRLRSNLEVGE